MTRAQRQKDRFTPVKSSVIAVGISTLLTACGGGSGGTDNPKPPPIVQNKAPQVTVSSVSEAEQGGEVLLSSSALDTDGTVEKYEWKQLEGTTVVLRDKDSASASFLAPYVPESEVLKFSLTVTDDDGSSSTGEVSITLKAGNLAPTVIADVPLEIEEREVLLLSATANDEDGEVVSFLWEHISGPYDTIRDSQQLQASMSVPSLTDETPDHTMVLKITVTDDKGATAFDTVSVKVIDVIVDPNAVVGENLEVSEGGAFTLDGTASHAPDGEIVSYMWQQVENGAPNIAINTPEEAKVTLAMPALNADTEFQFKLTVTDSNQNQGASILSVFGRDIASAATNKQKNTLSSNRPNTRLGYKVYCDDIELDAYTGAFEHSQGLFGVKPLAQPFFTYPHSCLNRVTLSLSSLPADIAHQNVRLYEQLKIRNKTFWSPIVGEQSGDELVFQLNGAAPRPLTFGYDKTVDLKTLYASESIGSVDYQLQSSFDGTTHVFGFGERLRWGDVSQSDFANWVREAKAQLALQGVNPIKDVYIYIHESELTSYISDNGIRESKTIHLSANNLQSKEGIKYAFIKMYINYYLAN
ncbi:PKD domain-containing protein [Pseudoalteromonas luteoviolacea]|uniref:Uncharacterized protein n=1 Tax=Pseudoalteromonas luteoviolacea S4060-1 TaxID=1365257 RepID=A0A167MQF3_9GAMM|nr:REJ domain-containing protein [Pseudoalteromonas luteoviolacea]KZN66783.1 hypothetical protein N478_18270 [Pseudoalteromonas luteoviolacea S4060-1]